MPLRVLTVASAVLLGIGAVLLAVYSFSQISASQEHQQGIEAFQAAREAQRSAADQADRAAAEFEREVADPSAVSPMAPVEADVSLAEPDKNLWSAKRIEEYERYRRAAVESDLPEGIMRIPAVNLELPVFTGTGEANLTRGAGRIEGTPPLGAPGNTGIAAHRDGYFRALKDVRIGDEIIIETMEAANEYRIVDLMIVNPEDIEVLNPTEENSLTLVTCYPFYYVGSAPQRFIVRASIL